MGQFVASPVTDYVFKDVAVSVPANVLGVADHDVGRVKDCLAVVVALRDEGECPDNYN